MGFFDELSSKGSEAIQGITNKTKNMGDIVRLKSTITESEKNINQYYLQIGKLYVQSHPSDYEKQFEELINALNGSIRRIEECRKEIKTLNGLINCPHCNAEIASTSAFCTSCGRPVAVNQPAPLRCAKCGAVVGPANRFCTSCGATVIAPNQAAAPNQGFNIYGMYTDQQQNTAPTAAPAPVATPAAPINDPFASYAENPEATAPAADPLTSYAVNSGEVMPDAPATGSLDSYVEDVSEAKPEVPDDNNDAFATYGMDEMAGDETPVTAEPVSEEPQADSSDSKKCPHCGAEVEADFAFCTECGARMQ